MKSTMSLVEKQIFMVDSNMIYINANKMFVDVVYKEIPYTKPVTRTRLFSNDLYSDYPGMEQYRSFASYFSTGIVLNDRSNTITTPFKTSLLPCLEMPKYEVFDKSYAECCDDRAKQILDTNKKLVVFWSGGIDSTTMLTALLKNSTKEQQQRISILMSNESILQNEKYYNDVICGNFDIIHTSNCVYYLGSEDYLCVVGENNDELFGTNFIYTITKLDGIDMLQDEPTISKLLSLLNRNKLLIVDVDVLEIRTNINLMNDIVDKCPIEVKNIFTYFWWLHFCLTWNVSYTRIMAFANHNISPEQNYLSFFNTKDFQLWSMNNIDKIDITSWKTIKQFAKDYIFSYHQDEVYKQNAIKKSHITCAFYNKPVPFCIDANMNRLYNVEDVENFLTEDNSFVCKQVNS